jgi:hypothetical protein
MQTDMAKLMYFISILFYILPETQNERPEQLPFSNICESWIVLVLKVFNLPCQTYHNRNFHLPTLQKRKILIPSYLAE